MKRIIATSALLLLMGCTVKPTYVKTDLEWNKDIKPIFDHNCYECHGRAKTAKGLNLMSDAVVKKNIWKIYKMVVQKSEMPPKNDLGINLSVSDRLDINNWIRGNAPGLGPGTPY